MANRFWKRDRASLEQGIIDLFASVAIGTTGAPTLSAANSKGVASVARNSAGRYTFTLQDPYARFLGMAVTVVKASGVPATASCVTAVVRTETVATTKTIVIEFLDNAGAAIELASGVTILPHFKLKNSSV